MSPYEDDSPARSRRRFLQLGGAAAGGLAAASMLPPSLREAIAAPPRKGGLDAIEHVVLIMQENRSFDHYFGTLRGVQGFGDRAVVRRRGGGTVFEQPREDGSVVLPFGIREAAERQSRDLEYVASLPHGWTDGQAAWAHGWYDGWLPAKGAATMAYYDRADLPFQYELADTFTLCDAYFCSVPTSTTPNRNYFVSGYTGYEPGTNVRVLDNRAAGTENTHPGYDWPTYAELLEKAGVSWNVYQEWDNWGDNNLEFFATFKDVMRRVLAPIEGGRHLNANSFYDSLWERPAAEQDAMLAELDAALRAASPADRSMFERGALRSRPGTIVESFAKDVAAGTLPAVSYVVTSAVDSEHPGASSPVEGASVTYGMLDALASNPDVWASTVVLLTFDEFDGYYDHVPPPVPPADVEDEYYQGGPLGLGPRVPMTIVSPWTVGGWVCSENFDHTSMTQFLEKWTGVRTPAISQWRRTAAGDLTSAFDFNGHSEAPEIVQPGPVPEFTGRWAAQPPEDNPLPSQEPGTRPSRALPYQPDAQVTVAGDELRVQLANSGTRPAHFAVYGWAGEVEAPVHADVAESQRIDLPLAGASYDVTVTGPHRFLRDFAGSKDGAAASLDVATQVAGPSRLITLEFRNRGTEALDVQLEPLAYGDRPAPRVQLRPGESRAVRWSTAEAKGWYDLEVTVSQDPTFRRRLTGRVENGRASISG